MKKELFRVSEKSMMVLSPTKLIIEEIDQQDREQISIRLYTDP
jgi:hypothetical protein